MLSGSLRGTAFALKGIVELPNVGTPIVARIDQRRKQKNVATNCLPMCNARTFLASEQEIAAGGRTDKPLSSVIMHEWQERNLNPALAACGTMAECLDCAVRPQKCALRFAEFFMT